VFNFHRSLFPGQDIVRRTHKIIQTENQQSFFVFQMSSSNLTAEQRERMRINKERALAKVAERKKKIAAQQRLQQQQHERPRIQQHQPQQQRRTTQTRGQPTSTTTAASPAYCPQRHPWGLVLPRKS
jgi:hypothetical protein